MQDNYVALKRRIDSLREDIADLSSRFVPSVELSLPTAGQGLDLLITPNELNLNHGTGVLLNRIFNPLTSVNIRSHDHYADKGVFRSHLVDTRGRSRPAVFSQVISALAKESIRRIVCVPYFPEDYLLGIAAKGILGVPMIVWVMDDLILHQSRVSRELAAELFDLADVRFVISAEMRDAYETAFQRKFYVLPPTVERTLALHPPLPDFSAHLAARTCAMIGNIWSRSWFERLIKMVKASGWTVHWYGRGAACSWLETSPEELRVHGIVEMGFVPEKELTTRLAAYPFSIIPTGTGTDDDDRKGVTMLSLPTRMPFLMAAARLPLLVVGSSLSCSAKFVERFRVGLAVGYDAKDFGAAVMKITDLVFGEECRRNAAASAADFSDHDLADWMWRSAAEGCAADDRFERPFRRQAGTIINYQEDRAPQDLYGDFQNVYLCLKKIARAGYRPDFVIDVGASTGVWSDTVNRVFPLARFILVEPLPGYYPQAYRERHPKFEWVAAAASNEEGKATFQVSGDLYGSSLFHPGDNRDYQAIEVPVTTLDAISVQKKVRGRGLMKIDVQFAEHLVLEGASAFLGQVDFLVMELTLRRCVAEARTFLEMINHMAELGFQYLDDIGDWRCPVHGTLEQKDVLFVRNETARQLGLG